MQQQQTKMLKINQYLCVVLNEMNSNLNVARTNHQSVCESMNGVNVFGLYECLILINTSENRLAVMLMMDQTTGIQ